jgi:hypothetical protein
MSYDDILSETLSLASTLTGLGVELPEQSRAALAVRDALVGVVYGPDPVTDLAADIQAGAVTVEDAPARALATLDNLARRDHVSQLSVAMLLPHSRAIRNPIIADHDGMLDQLRDRFTESAAAITKAKAVKPDLTAEQAVDLETKDLTLWRGIPDAAARLDGIRTAVLHLARLNDTTKHVADFLWFVADSDDTPQAAEVYRDATGRGAPWHHLAAAGHTLRLATIEEAVNNAARHVEGVTERQRKLDEHLAVTRRTPLEQSRIDRDVAWVKALR